MLNTETTTQVSTPLSQDQILTALLEATGDLDTAHVLQKTLPDWLIKASPTTLAALDKTVRESQACQAKVDASLQKLQPLKTFCTSELTSALAGKWPVTFDVEKDFLELPGADCGCSDTQPRSAGVASIPPATHSLVEAAMQNFTEEEAAADGFPAGSHVRVASSPSGVAGLTPATFATYCRALNLGQRYQQHFLDVFGLQNIDGKVVASGSIVRDIKQLKRQLMLIDTHTSFMKGHISEAVYTTLQALIDGSATGNPATAETIVHETKPLIMQGIEVHKCCVWGVVVFSVRSVEQFPNEWCLVYMPGEPHRPLFEYPRFADFKQYLTLKLNVGSYKDYFAHGIDEDSKVEFFTTFNDTRNLGFIKQLPITTSLFDFMVQSHVGKMQIDARKLAVPTADVDEDVRQQRLLSYLEVGLTIGMVAGFFVPVVGQLMMGVALGQLLAEVYEGVQDWRQGDKDEALSHLLSVAENIALMGAFAAGQKGLSSLVSKAVHAHPQFFRQFEAVINAGGHLRLWKTDLKPYEQPFDINNQLSANPQGLHPADGQTYVRIDQRTYSIGFDSVTKTWKVKHPVRYDAYTPALEHNGEGGWRHPSEHPEEWGSGTYVLRRIDPRLAIVDESRLEKIRKVTGTSLSQLHHLSDENLPLPGRFRDTVERFRLDQKLRRFITDMERGETHNARHAQEQLQLLPSLPGWPAGRYIQVIDDELEVIAVYPKTAAVDDPALSVEVSEEQLRKGELLEKVVDGLYQHEVDSLLGVKTPKEMETLVLAKTLGAAVKAERKPLFDELYERYDSSETSDVQALRRVFPDMPARMAQELIANAPSVERLHLRKTGRVPMGLAQTLGEASSDVRLDRALTGLYLPEIAGPDTEKLAVQLLSRLSGWDENLRLEVREGTSKGKLLESLGKETEDVARKCIVVKSAAGHEAFTGDGTSLGAASSGPDSLYEAVLKAIPPRQRIAMGYAEVGDSWRLRGHLLDNAMDERSAAARILSTGTIEPRPSNIGCIQGDSPVSQATHPSALLRKVKKLYPLFSDPQASAFLEGLGRDHLTRANRVKALQQSLKKLRTLLHTWSENEADLKALPGELSEYRQSRRVASDNIENSWRRLFVLRNDAGLPVRGLKLDGMRIGKLPTLPPEVTFDHVTHLSLKNMELGNDVAYFLKAFKNLESLQLDTNKLTQLPEVLSLMPELKQLSLAGNQLKLTEQTLLKLSNMRSLETLNLSNNPLGATPDVSRMFDLRFLSVRETGATELPKGLARLPNLDRVDLRDNNIRDLPDWLFNSPKRFSETVNLRHNPLSLNSRSQLSVYRDSVGVGMGYLEDDIARLNEQQARTLWLPQEVDETYLRRNSTWTAFKDDPVSDGLFRLLSELGDTADSQHVREDMTRRVWRVLEAAESNATLREQVLDLAANPINCTDTAALNFSNLEIAVEIDKVINPSGSAQSTAAPLLKLGRGLFRLDQLDRVAQEHVQSNPTTDPLEVSLALRTGLAETFELPGQPRHMRYASLSGVTQSVLDIAQNRVISAELSPALLKFFVQQPFWCDYLKRHYPRQFAAVNETYPAMMEAVFEKADSLTTGDYLSQINTIKAQKDLAENAVLERLTVDALKLADLGICIVPDY
jgi:Leucine-rich repeat (LRR) protein